MSVEHPEARILARQMGSELPGKRIESCALKDCERLQKIGFMNRDAADYQQLVGGAVESVVSRGNTVRVKLDNGWNLLVTPEYGGRVLHHDPGEASSEKYHLRLDFTDGAVLTVRLTSMGVIQAVEDDGLDGSYIYRRDFSETLSPDDERLTPELFSALLGDEKKMLKGLLVGKNAIVVGLSNSVFQDIAYRARIHPKRKGSRLSEDEIRALYGAMRLVIDERLRLGGKDQFMDLYGNRGGYTPAMGPHMKGQDCSRCGNPIEGLQVSGGVTYICPACQQ